MIHHHLGRFTYVVWGVMAGIVRNRKTKPLNGNGLNGDIAKIDVAAQYLNISPLTLRDYIYHRKFTAKDGLRRIGGSIRIHMPTLIARVEADTLMGRQ